MNNIEIKEHIDIDNYLDFSNQFTVDNTKKNGFKKRNIDIKIDGLIANGKYSGFRISEIKGNIIMAPIYNDLDFNSLEGERVLEYNQDLNLIKIGHELKKGNFTYFYFDKDNKTNDFIDSTEDKIKNIIE